MNQQPDVQFRGLAPYLFYEDAEAALEWLSRVLGFTERARYVDEEGVVREAEMTAGEAEIHMAGMGPGHWDRSGVSGPIGQLVIVYVDDVDAHHARAIAAGAEAPAPEDKPYAARVYTVQDPGGNTWTMWQHLRDDVELAEGGQEIRTHRRGADGASGQAGRPHEEQKAMAGELAFFEIGVGDAERGRAF